jgi:hypothetical protein
MVAVVRQAASEHRFTGYFARQILGQGAGIVLRA